MAAHGGPSSTTMSRLERGIAPPSAKSFRKLDVGLSWEPGSAKRTLNGGDPTPLPLVAEVTRRIEAAYRHIAALQTELDLLQAEAAAGELSAAKEARADELRGQLAAAQLAAEQMRHGQLEAVKDARSARLVALWLLAHRVSHPEILGTPEFADAAVALARQVAVFTEAEVGGYSRMQELRQLGNSAEDCVVELVSPPAASHGDDLAAAAQADLLNGAQDEVDVFGAPGVGGNCGEGRTKSTEGAAG